MSHYLIEREFAWSEVDYVAWSVQSRIWPFRSQKTYLGRRSTMDEAMDLCFKHSGFKTSISVVST